MVLGNASAPALVRAYLAQGLAVAVQWGAWPGALGGRVEGTHAGPMAQAGGG